jgi:hypothetical protein
MNPFLKIFDFFAWANADRGRRLVLYLIVLMAFVVVWSLYGRVEAVFSACTHVLTNDQIKKITGVAPDARTASHDDDGACAG